MKITKKKFKFRNNYSKKYKNNKNNTNKKRKKNYHKKFNKIKKLKGGVESNVRRSGRSRKRNERFLDVTSKQFEEQQRIREKQKNDLKEQKKKEKEEQQKINKVEDDSINKEILDEPVSDKDIIIVLEDKYSPQTNYKLKVNFRDIIVWKALTEIKKDIQKKLLGISDDTKIEKKYLNKYHVLHKELFKDTFEKIVLDLDNDKFDKLKKVDDQLNEILNDYIKLHGSKFSKYPGVPSYIKNAFDEFKTYIFPKSVIIKDYSLFSYLVNFYYNIEFSTNSEINTKTGVRYNNKVKKRVQSLNEKLAENKFITDYPEYQHILQKYNRLNGTELKNSDLIHDENYIGYQLTDKDITDILSIDELNEYASTDNKKFEKLINEVEQENARKLRTFENPIYRQDRRSRSTRDSDSD